MVDRNLIREFNVDDDELDAQFGQSLDDLMGGTGELDFVIDETAKGFDSNQIVVGTVIETDGEEVLVDIGYKSEGVVPLNEWADEETKPQPGDKIEVLLEEVEGEQGLIMLSKRKADRMKDWLSVVQSNVARLTTDDKSPSPIKKPSAAGTRRSHAQA